jgi:opacity protein-like surface antigen
MRIALERNIGDNKMKKLLAFTLLALSGAVIAGDSGGDGTDAPRNKPFIMVDTSMEKDAYTSLANEYINVNLTMGVKTPSKTEFSVKVGASAKDVQNSTSDKLTNNIEFKLKQSFDIGTFFLPYVAVRLGEKFDYDTTHFTHYAFDAGLKLPLSDKLALDVGARYRNAFDTAEKYRSTRLHAMVLYDIDKSNTVGLRYTQSDAQVAKPEEERKGWRVHYQRNY